MNYPCKWARNFDSLLLIFGALIVLIAAKISAKFFQLFPKPLLTIDQLTLLKYDNIPSSKYQTNFDLGVPSSKIFDQEVEKYCYMWREGGQFSTKKYRTSNS